MEVKKTPKANLEKNRGLNTLMGVVLVVSFLFVGFAWSNAKFMIATDDGASDVVAEEEMDIAVQEEMSIPSPPPLPAQIDPEVLHVVEDEATISREDMMSSEETQIDRQQDIYVPPVVEAEEVASDEIFMIVEKMPEFPGGQGKLMSFIAKSIKYPVVAQENGVQGRVTVAFVVNKNGSIVDAEVVRGVDASLDKEALRVINSMPKWRPGEQREKPVRVKYTIPINFRLQN